MTSLRNVFWNSHHWIILIWSFLIMIKIWVKSFIKTFKLLTDIVLLQNHSSFAFSILFVKKLSRELHFCIDYQALNAITIWNWYLIFLIQETLNQLSKTQYFMKLDIIAVFNQIYIQKNDKKYTVFWTWWNLFEQLVMLFNLKNEFSIFQHYINDKFHDFLDIFVIAYIDDILIYSSTLSEHQKHVWMILEQLQKIDL